MVKNAIIKSAQIQENHGCLTVWLHLDCGKTSQSFGGYALHVPDRNKSFMGHAIWSTMKMCGVRDWVDVPGKAIRVRTDNSGDIIAIGHIIREEWFDPSVDFS